MQPPLRIAILECDTPLDQTRAKYGGYGGVFKALLSAAADALQYPGLSSKEGLELSVFDVVNAQKYPDLEDIDAVLLTGSRFNSFDSDPWILKLVDFTKKLLEQDRVRIIGVCFGHQIIGRAAGVEVGRSEGGWEVSVLPVELTEKGKELFKQDTLALHQMHRDAVFAYPPGVEKLGASPRCLVQGMYVKGKYITVQGHPEFTQQIVSELVTARHGQGIFNEEQFKDAMARPSRHHAKPPSSMGKWRYGVILDAGSSGTRVHIYRWLNSDKARAKASDAQLQSLPVIETDKKWTKKIHPGISTFGPKPEDVGPDHLEELLTHALKHVPLEEVPNTPLFLLATAGMRILPEGQRAAVLGEVCDFAKRTTQFQLPDCDLHVQVIPGETEGLYGWIAANYLLGGFDNASEHDHGKGHHTYGFLDMGGASAQIAFAPNATEAEKHANDLTLLRLRNVGGTPMEYKVFVTTWLGFGVNQARQRYVKALSDASPDSLELPDPCLPLGLKITKEGKPIEAGSHEEQGHEPYLIGTGKFSECMHQTYPLLEKEKECTDSPCLINGQHVPAIDFDVNHFVGVSEYWHTTHEVFEMAHKDKAYDFKTYQERVSEFCSQTWDDIEKGVGKKKWGKKVDEQTAQEVCFKASWLINMLHDGIGVPRVGIEELKDSKNTTKAVLDEAKKKGFLDPFQAVNKINDVEVSWTLGKMVLYASSEVPPPSPSDTEPLLVGFGTNDPSGKLPADFQRPGGSYKAWGTSDDNEGHLFSENPRRIPGFLIFLLILFVVFFLLLGRERRSNLSQKVLSPFRRSPGGRHSSLRRRRGFPGKLFGLSSTPSYERVDEEAADDFELGSFSDTSDNDHSDSTDGSRIGRTSGWATPQIKAGMADPGTPPYFEPGRNIVSEGAGLGLGPSGAFTNPIDRGGLMSRTDSRERLKEGRRSRASSPGRMRSPMMTSLKET
ncbi:nucleoside phosphatase family-domain-containing protein [Lophiotrema nucula]|uniref:Nucleoside phosphatase family-domain-containing protein n=1 Tax=Lophiotrema nucula TaxID=690887 RepID=A0A6A5ZQH6_9PLEO|nr:nucleoside phosphatase family-domain-containing protein [Lophiotrema nucula]